MGGESAARGNVAYRLGPVHHVAFTVSDLDRSVAFYSRFGFEVETKFESAGPAAEAGTGVPNAHLTIAMLKRGDLRLELIRYASSDATTAPPNNSVGAAHLCFEVHEIDRVCQEMRTDGLEFVSTPHFHDQQVYWVYLRDPDGIIIELLEPIDSRGREDH